MREGAILDPTEAPTTTPTSEKTPARKPVLAPRSTDTTTKSAMSTSRKLSPPKSTHGFYIVGTLRPFGLRVPARRLPPVGGLSARCALRAPLVGTLGLRPRSS